MTQPFDGQQETFTIANALFLARACQAAYMTDPKLKAAAAGLGLQDVAPFHADTGTDGFVAQGAGFVLVAFRGTEMDIVADLLTDVQIRQVPSLDGKVHSGNHSSIESVWPGILASVRTLAPSDRPIWVTGHSLGGALATIAAARLYNEGMRPVRALTFGAPRVGNDAFRRAYKPALFRVVNHRDIVPHLPTDRRVLGDLMPALVFALTSSIPMMNLDYTHAGAMKFLDRDGKLDEAKTEAGIVAATALEALRNLSMLRQPQTLKQLNAKMPQSITDHVIADYVSVLEKA